MHVYYLRDFAVYYSLKDNLPEDKLDEDDFFFGLTNLKMAKKKLYSYYSTVQSFSVLVYALFLYF